MSKIRNVSGEDRTLAADVGGRLVLAGGVIDVAPEAVYGYTQQSIWEPVDEEAQAAHDEAHAAYLAALAADLGVKPAQDAPGKSRAAKKTSSKEA